MLRLPQSSGWLPGSLLQALCALVSRYEGTGRSLSLKLIQQLRQQSAQSQVTLTAENKSTATAKLTSGTAPLGCVSLWLGLLSAAAPHVPVLCSCGKGLVWGNDGTLLASGRRLLRDEKSAADSFLIWEHKDPVGCLSGCGLQH